MIEWLLSPWKTSRIFLTKVVAVLALLVVIITGVLWLLDKLHIWVQQDMKR
jgi:heme/copper-type cytochrome/quinol oxidase subunit 4